MRIAIYDDCMEDVLSLKKFLENHEVDIYSDACSLLEKIQNRRMRYDLYLLDIFMEESMNGIELAEKLRKAQEEAVICFISASNGFYREAYDLYAVQYLLKPVQEESLKKLLQKVQKSSVREREESLIYSWWGKKGAIPYRKIRYISSREHTLYIYCADGKIQKSKGKLSELATRVCAGNSFMRCHQSFLVNMFQVDNLSGTDLTVAGEQIPVSRRYYAEVKRRYQEILFEEVD